MPVMDEFKEEREALKHGTLKQKLSYFWDYYKWHVIVTVFVVIAGSTLVSQILNRKETAFYLALINTLDLTSAEPEGRNFTEYSGIDTEDYTIIYDTSMRIDFATRTDETVNSAEKFVVYLTAKELDAVVSDTDIIQKYAYNETFHDLSQFLTPEQTEKYKPYFYYIDYAVVEDITAAQEAYDYSFVPEYPDPRHPENMEQPIPVGIYVTGRPALTDRFYFIREDSDIVLSVVGNTTRPDMVRQYIDFLMTD